MDGERRSTPALRRQAGVRQAGARPERFAESRPVAS
jgi:hypothetical protein